LTFIGVKGNLYEFSNGKRRMRERRGDETS
jgi:hypothetical protein